MGQNLSQKITQKQILLCQKKTPRRNELNYFSILNLKDSDSDIILQLVIDQLFI